MSTEKAKKFDGNKVRMDLIPIHPLRVTAEVLTVGAKKYGDRNWENGLDYSRCYGAALRHLTAWWEGEELAPDDHQHHLGSVIANCMFLLEYLKTHPEKDDRPGKQMQPGRVVLVDHNPSEFIISDLEYHSSTAKGQPKMLEVAAPGGLGDNKG